MYKISTNFNEKNMSFNFLSCFFFVKTGPSPAFLFAPSLWFDGITSLRFYSEFGVFNFHNYVEVCNQVQLLGYPLFRQNRLNSKLRAVISDGLRTSTARYTEFC